MNKVRAPFLDGDSSVNLCPAARGRGTRLEGRRFISEGEGAEGSSESGVSSCCTALVVEFAGDSVRARRWGRDGGGGRIGGAVDGVVIVDGIIRGEGGVWVSLGGERSEADGESRGAMRPGDSREMSRGDGRRCRWRR